MTRTHTIVDSPIGPLRLVAEDHALCALFMEAQRHLPLAARFGERKDAGFGQVVEQLDQYFARQRHEFDIPIRMVGNPFQLQVWNALTTIPYGETRSYGQIAAQIGKPGAARAVGATNGQNPISIIVPCHRVIGASGKLVGYGGGLRKKQFLLDVERPVVAQALFDSVIQ